MSGDLRVPLIRHPTKLSRGDEHSSYDYFSLLHSQQFSEDGVDDPLDELEAQSSYGYVDDPACTIKGGYLKGVYHELDLTASTIAAFRRLSAPAVEDLPTDGKWETALRALLLGEATPAYRVCRRHGGSGHIFLQCARPVRKAEAMGALVGRLVESARWEAEVGADAVNLCHHKWEIGADQLKSVSEGAYDGPDLTIDLKTRSNELLHLHDSFFDESGPAPNTEICTSLIWDPQKRMTVPVTVLYATQPIKPKELLTIDWGDEFWSDLSESENTKVAATAWGTLHFPLLALRDLGRRYGVNVEVVAPYYPEEVQAAKRRLDAALKDREAAVKTAPALSDSSQVGTLSFGTEMEGFCSRIDRRKRQRRRPPHRLSTDAMGGWYLDEGDGPKLLIQGTPNWDKQPKTMPSKEESFRIVSDLQLRSMACFTTECDFSSLPEEVTGRLRDTSAKYAERLPKNERDLVDSGKCPKLRVTEITSLHHPVRFLTRPDRRAYGVNVAPGCTLKFGEAAGVYVGKVLLEKEYENQENLDVDKQVYTYTMSSKELEVACGLRDLDCNEIQARRVKTDQALPTLTVDACRAGNALRFVNDVYAREGCPGPNVFADCRVDNRTGQPYMMFRWGLKRAPRPFEELVIDYGADFWRIGGRALHRELKQHAEVRWQFGLYLFSFKFRRMYIDLCDCFFVCSLLMYVLNASRRCSENVGRRTRKLNKPLLRLIRCRNVSIRESCIDRHK